MAELLHPEETITSFLLIRHGATRATEEGKLYTDPDAPLTERGRQQAEGLADWLPEIEPDVLLTSPSMRVRTTADIIGASLGMQPAVVEGLNEWSVGDWEGRTYLDIKKSEPELYRRWSEDPIHNAPPNGESIQDLCARAGRFIRQLTAEHEGRRIALVTHAGIVRGFIVHALGMPVENFWRLSVPTGSVSRVDFSANFATLHYSALKPGFGLR